MAKSFRLPESRHSTVREHVLHPRRRHRAGVLPALGGVSFDVQRGSCVGIIGRNGSGKSTLLRCMAGIYPPSAGRSWSPVVWPRSSSSGLGSTASSTARENLITSGMLFGLSAREARR